MSRLNKVSTIVRTNPLFLCRDSTVGDLWDARNLSTLFTDTGATTNVTASTNSVKAWKGSRWIGNTPTEATNAPTYQASLGGCVRFDGAASVLTLTSAFDIINTGGCTMIACLNGSPATNAFLCGCGNSVSTNLIYSLFHANASTATSNDEFIRADDVTTALASTVLNTLTYDSTARVIAAVDNGSSVVGYKNGVAGDAATYTRSGLSFTPDRFGIGALVRTGPSLFFAMDLYSLFVIGRALTQTEVIAASRFMGRSAGIYF